MLPPRRPPRRGWCDEDDGSSGAEGCEVTLWCLACARVLMSIVSGDVLAPLHTSTLASMCIGFGLLALLKVLHSLAISSYRAGSNEYAQVSTWRAAGMGEPLRGAGLSAATDNLVDEVRAAAGTSELLEHCRREVVHLEARDAIAPALALHVAL
eukprot:scaffold43106_cov63-Phaeocystis_antarctica.AAC.1